MKLLIAGDLSLQGRAQQCSWSDEQLRKAFADVRNIVGGCDRAIVNLESPVTENNSFITKDGPNLKNPLEVFNIVRFCGFDAVTLANNHLKDFGGDGVVDTLKQCKKHGIETVGAGTSLKEARKAMIIRGDDLKLGILNVCEHESSIATKNTPGAAPYDFSYLFEDIANLKDQVDKIVVIIHGGKEHYQLPTPRMKREYHMILDFGADIIVNHHQHCYSGYEKYKEKLIFYGLGNFFFESHYKVNGKWTKGLLLKLDIRKEKTDFELIPYKQCDEDIIVKVEDYTGVEDKINQLNDVIQDDKKLEDAFEQLVNSSRLLAPFLPFGNRILRALYYRHILSPLISKSNKAIIENAMSCETHRELLLKYFYNILHNKGHE